MKNTILVYTGLFLVLIFPHILSSQTPEMMSYQAVARDLSGNPMINTTLTVGFQIRQGSATGAVVYSEIQTRATNLFGLFTAEIGGGTVVTGSFSGITWGSGSFYLTVAINGFPMGVTQLLSVPYALYSKQSLNGSVGADGKNSLTTSTPEAAGANCVNGGHMIDVGLDDNGDGTLQAGELDLTYYVCDGVGNVKDTSETNELQTISISNDTLFLSNGGYAIIPSVIGDDWGADVVNTLGGNITGDGTAANPLIVTDNDTSPTNELEFPMTGNTIGDVMIWDGAKWVAGASNTNDGDWAINGSDMHSANFGKIGIGINSPNAKLHVEDTTGVAGVNLLNISSSGVPMLTVIEGPLVGIGIPNPTFPLDVRTDINNRGAYIETNGVNSTSSKIGVTGIANNGAGSGDNKGGDFNAMNGNGGNNIGIEGVASGGVGFNYGIRAWATGSSTGNWAGYFSQGDVYVADNLGINTSTPSASLDVVGTMQLVDGNEGAGKILTSDASGNATWAYNSIYNESPSLNTTPISVTTSWQAIGPAFTVNKAYAGSKIEVTFNSHIIAGTITGGGTRVQFEIRIGGNVATFDNKGVIQGSGSSEFISMLAVFEGLTVGAHTVQVYTRSDVGTFSGVVIDPGGWGGRMISKETF